MKNAADKIQAAADKLKKTPDSVAGYQIEKALMKHKPYLINGHAANLAEYVETKGKK